MPQSSLLHTNAPIHNPVDFRERSKGERHVTMFPVKKVLILTAMGYFGEQMFVALP